MSRVVIKNLNKCYGGSVKAADNVSLELADGELFALLGSSGCGKTTVLRCIAGLERPDSGSIIVDGADINALAVQKRDCGMVFQNYALFPHLTVRENVAYGLAAERYARSGWLGKLGSLWNSAASSISAEDEAKVKEMLKMAELSETADRLPAQLSGGQQQRVALARALITKPKILLFDEPLGALDAKLRLRMCREISAIQKKFAITALYVTHDREEALSVADRIAVMDKGRILQAGTPEEIFLRPQKTFVADFVGIGNIFKAVYEGEGRFSFDGGTAYAGNGDDRRPQAGSVCFLAVRAEFVSLEPPEGVSGGVPAAVSGINVWTGEILEKAFRGGFFKVFVKLGGSVLEAAVSIKQSARLGKVGDGVLVKIAADDILILEEN
ncbi:ABC transporter ATP-binding protein [bacterium]|nr:ABC transporter ATP-binding protein [bacterium]